MKKVIFIVFIILYYISAQACEVIDDTGQVVHLNHPAKRIISLAPDMTESLFAVGAFESIVGVVKGSDYPLQAKKRPVVADHHSVDMEAILLLHPDLIVAWADSRYAMQLKKSGIPVYLSQQRTLTDIPRTLQKLGCLAGTEKMAKKAADDFSNRYLKLKNKYTNQPVVSVFYQAWPNPLMTISKQSWINEVILLCSGKNIFAELKGAAPEVNIEAVIYADPDVMIGTNSQVEWQKQWRSWNMLRSVKNHHLYTINPDLIERAGPRLLDGAELICLHINNARLKKDENV